MLTVHHGTLNGVAVAVRGDLIEAVGSRADLTARYPHARVRDWPGSLGPALVHTGEPPDAPSPRERIHAILKLGATAVRSGSAGPVALREAAVRGGVRVLPDDAAPPGLDPADRADLAVFAADGGCLATVLAGRVVHRRA